MTRRESEPTIAAHGTALGADLDRICDSFEAAWRAGNPPTLESLLGDLPEAKKPKLFRELLYVELGYRRKRGETLQAESLSTRFPQFAAIIREVFSQLGYSGEDTTAIPAKPGDQAGSAGAQKSAAPGPGQGSSAPDRFQPLRLHAKGGLGEVFVAQDHELARQVALKEINARFAGDAEARERFVREAEITGRLEHPGIVPVYGLGRHPDGRPYYAMRFIQGESLQQAIQSYFDADRESSKDAGARILELRKLLQRFIDVCNAIAYAHSRGVLHRDIKPGNIMLGKFGETLVVDWGLAKIVGRPAEHQTDCEATVNLSLTGDSSATRMGSIVGTLAYMSPEQADGLVDQLQPASDVYCLGATLYCLLTGRPPFAGDAQQVLRDIRSGRFPPPRQIRKDVPAGLEAICLKAMSVRPEDRYLSARALADDLEHWLADEPVSAVRENAFSQLARWMRRHRAWVQAGALAAVGLAVVSLLAAGLIHHAGQERLIAIEHEADAKAIAALTRSFETGLNAKDWTLQQVASQETLVDEIARYDARSVVEARERLYQRFAEAIESDIRRARLTDATMAGIDEKLALLVDRRPDLAKPLSGLLASRRGDWQPLASMAAPYPDRDRVFPGHYIRLDETTKSLAHSQPRARDGSTVVTTTISCDAAARIEVEWDSSWESASRLGCVLQSGGKPAYEFSLSVEKGGSRTSEADETSPSADFSKARSRGASVLVEIWREGNILRRESFPAARLPAGPLKFRCQREVAQLSLQIAGLDSIEVFDPFPIAAHAARVALRWPNDVRLRKLDVFQHESQFASTEFDKADEAFHKGSFDEAVLEYGRLAVGASDAPLRQEAQAKLGICLMRLNRPDEAARQFEELLREPGDRWPALAGCELWLLRLRQKRDSEADAIAQLLVARFVPAQIVPLTPGDVREEILNHYHQDFREGSKRVRFNPRLRQNLDLYLVIDRLFSRDGQQTPRGLSDAIEACEMLDDLPQAIAHARQLKKIIPLAGASVLLTRLLRLNKEIAAARQEIDRATDQFRNALLGEAASILIERARLAWIEKGPQAAKEDIVALEAILDHDAPEKPNMDLLWAAAPASLLCGWYHKEIGEEDVARRYWTKGMRFVAHEIRLDHYVGYRTIEHFVMLAGLSEQPDHDTVRRATQILLKSDNPLISVAGPMIGSEKVEAIATQVWRTERGRKVALDFALDRTTKPQAAEDSVVLVGWYALRQSAFDNDLDDEHDKLVWEITKTIYEHIVLDGKLSTSQLVQLSAAWGGISGVLGWDGVANNLPPQTRAPFAYILSHRSRRLGQSAQAQKLLRDAADHAPPDTLLKRLAQQELDKPSPPKPKPDPAP